MVARQWWPSVPAWSPCLIDARGEWGLSAARPSPSRKTRYQGRDPGTSPPIIGLIEQAFVGGLMLVD